MKQLNEKLVVGEYFYPYADKVKDKLYSFIKSFPNEGNPGGSLANNPFIITRRNLYNYKEVELLLQWITQIVNRDFCNPFPQYSYQVHSDYDLKCYEMWGITYKKGGYISPHSHNPNTYSFSYNLNIPKNSPPLVFTSSGYKVKPKEGQLIIFESRLLHHVPQSKVDDRCVISGCFGKTRDEIYTTSLVQDYQFDSSN